MNYKSWLLIGTALGIVGGCVASEPPQYNHGSREEQLLQMRIVYGAGIGFVIGLAVDLLVNGIPPRSTWRFSLRMLLLAVAVCALLCYDIAQFLQVRPLKP